MIRAVSPICGCDRRRSLATSFSLLTPLLTSSFRPCLPVFPHMHVVGSTSSDSDRPSRDTYLAFTRIDVGGLYRE